MILVISTEKNSHFSTALADCGGLKIIKTVRKKFQQSELLLKTIDGLLKKIKLSGIIVVKGPGDFSALRIGISTANALAYAWRLPIAGVKLRGQWSGLPEKEKLAQILKTGQRQLKNQNNRRIILPVYGLEPNIG